MGNPGGGQTQDARAQASLQSIMAGNLPLNAIDRLQEQARRQGTPGHIFTSDLSVNELLLTDECGFEPLGQVMGSCAYNVGWQYLPTSGFFNMSGELETQTACQADARFRAFRRLRQEAKLLRADGVVGVELRMQEADWGVGMIEFIAVGTAVRRKNAPPLTEGQEPFVSNLSGQDHWRLRKDGYAPVGFAFGNCSWFQYPDWLSQNAMMSWSNAELTSISQGVYSAREMAMERVEREALDVRAEGVVGVTINSRVERVELSNNNSRQYGFLIHFTAYGTAVGREDYHSGVDGIQPYISLLDKSTSQQI